MPVPVHIDGSVCTPGLNKKPPTPKVLLAKESPARWNAVAPSFKTRGLAWLGRFPKTSQPSGTPGAAVTAAGGRGGDSPRAQMSIEAATGMPQTAGM
jgi:hypothetical protein